MRSRTTIELFQYWNAIRGGRDLPRRDEIAPADIRSLLPDLFILQKQADGTIRYRLAGTRVCTLFGCELRGQRFSVLWRDTETAEVTTIAERVMTHCAPMLISARGETAAGDVLELEVLLAPLASADGDNDRVLGALSPLSGPPWLHTTPIGRLATSGLSALDPRRNAELDEARTRSGATSVGVVDGRNRRANQILHLRVFDGGRRD